MGVGCRGQSVAVRQDWKSRHGLEILKDVHVDSTIFYGLSNSVDVIFLKYFY